MALSETGGEAFKLRRLSPADAALFAPLVADYAGALTGQPAETPDEPYAETLLRDPVVEVLGAEVAGRLIGFALYYDLPEAISGKRAGQLDDLYVDPLSRRQGVAKALIEALVAEGIGRNWIHLRWMVPETSPAAALYDRVAERAPWRNYVIRIDRSAAW